MIGKTPKEQQMSIFDVVLESFIDMNHELVIGHWESNHQMMRNFLKGTRGDVINKTMAAAA